MIQEWNGQFFNRIEVSSSQSGTVGIKIKKWDFLLKISISTSKTHQETHKDKNRICEKYIVIL